MLGSNGANFFNQASKQNQSQTPLAVISNQTKTVDQKPTSVNKQTGQSPVQKQKTQNPFTSKNPISQPKSNVFTTQNPNIFAGNKGSNIFSNPTPKSDSIFNRQATGVFGKSDSSNNPQKSNLFQPSANPLFGSKIQPNQTKPLNPIFGSKTNEENSKNDKNLTNKVDVAGKQSPFSLASQTNQSNSTTQQKNVSGMKTSPQANSLFGAKNQPQKPNIFSAQQKNAPNLLFGSSHYTPGFLNFNKPQKQPQLTKEAQKKEEPKKDGIDVQKQQPQSFKQPTNPLFNKQPEQKIISEPIFPLIPEHSRQQSQPLSQTIKYQNIPPILTEKKQQILSILNQIQKKGENIELESKLQQFTQSQLQSVQILNENSEQQKKLLQQKLSKSNELLTQKKDQVQKLKKQYQNQKCFKSIIDHFNNQSSDKFQDEKNGINNQMTNLVRQVDQYYKGQIQNVNPEIQLRNLFKNIQKQKQNQHNLAHQQENHNKQNVQTLKKVGRAKTTKDNADQFLGKRKQSWLNKSKQQVENKDGQTNYFQKLKAQNKAQIEKLMRMRKSQAIEKKVTSRITEGRTSMIMKSIIME